MHVCMCLISSPITRGQHLREQNISSVARGYVFVQVVPACLETGDCKGGPRRPLGFASQVVAWEGASSCWAPMNDDAVLAFSRALSTLSTAD